MIHIHQSEAFGEAIVPLEVINERPDEVAAQVNCRGWLVRR
jgi:hypothetical protein